MDKKQWKKIKHLAGTVGVEGETVRGEKALLQTLLLTTNRQTNHLIKQKKGKQIPC